MPIEQIRIQTLEGILSDRKLTSANTEKDMYNLFNDNITLNITNIDEPYYVGVFADDKEERVFYFDYFITEDYIYILFNDTDKELLNKASCPCPWRNGLILRGCAVALEEINNHIISKHSYIPKINNKLYCFFYKNEITAEGLFYAFNKRIV